MEISEQNHPHTVNPNETQSPRKNKELAGAGTTKRKELHGTVQVHALSGSWKNEPHGSLFHSYKIDFTCDTEEYSGYVLLTGSKLDHDVANAKIDLYLLDKTAKSSVSPCGEVKLDSDQIKRAMCFHELLFNGLFGKLFLGSAKSREFLLQKDGDRLWSMDNTYLILPLEKSSDVKINWNVIDSCVTVVAFIKSSSWLTTELPEGETRKSTALDLDSAGDNIINLANCSFQVTDLKDMVVMAIHTGRIYYVIDMLSNTSSHSPFDTDRYPNFYDYFNKKYGIELSYPDQPLLLLKQTHNPFNLLSDSEAGAFRRKKLSSGIDQKPNNLAHLPPELLINIGIPLPVLRALYLIPSVMHRLESLMLACQLREEIGNPGNFNIPSLLVLEAITTLRCCEDVSSERLELLGDSVLKYTVTCHWFLKYPEEQEGKLSSHRQRAICNAALHTVGIKQGLHEYIRDSPFEPRRWVAPGQLSVLPASCKHGIEESKIPLDGKFQTYNENVVLGKCCDRGHRWLVSKNIADCVEAVIGAYYVAGGLVAALHVMKWMGIDAELDPSHVDRFADVAFDEKSNHIIAIESKLGYEFTNKGLLLEAITHSSYENDGVKTKYCYERLEFLGDAVLDLLITKYLYENHVDIDPGELTDLRSASVNNVNFAQVVVKGNLFEHLLHSSPLLAEQVTEYVNLIKDSEEAKTLQGRPCPKALGDLFESIVGAVLIGSKLRIDEVWRVFYPLLSPIPTPDNLELPPFRELNELCDFLGYFVKDNCSNLDEMVFVEITLQLEDVLLIVEGIGRTRKAARGEAAFHLLKDLESRGISYARFITKNKKREVYDAPETVSLKKQKINPSPIGPTGPVPVISLVNGQKGGPRVSIYELCKTMQWPMPTFESTGHQTSFVSRISMCIPDFGVVEAKGEERGDKKSSQDSAALSLLLLLEKQGMLVIDCS